MVPYNCALVSSARPDISWMIMIRGQSPRVTADDTPWAAGQGHEITGPIGALLLLLTGRPAALRQLSGPGVTHLRELLTPSAAA
jgi:hypothetical protein